MTIRIAALALVLLATACRAPAQNASSEVERPFITAPVATFNSPWAIAFLPGTNRALVTEKAGKLWLVEVSNGRKQGVADVPTVVLSGQGGLLDVAAAPDFSQSHLVYLTYAEPSQEGGSQLALARAVLAGSDGRGWKLDRAQVVWRDPEGGRGGQFGARIAFAPDGKSLFLSSGERQRFTPAQDPSQPLGKILHLTLDGNAARDNPWFGKNGAPVVTVTDPPSDTEEAAAQTGGRSFRWPGANPTPSQTWTLGHRNPLGLAFAPDGRLWETEMGPRGGDELNLIERGKNYGWPVVSDGKNYDGVPIADHHQGDGFEPPRLFWNPVISPGGLLIYKGTLFPAWRGDALIAALSGQALVHVRIRGDRAEKAERWDMGNRIRAVAEGPGGAVYLLQDGEGGRLLRLAPAAPNGGR